MAEVFVVVDRLERNWDCADVLFVAVGYVARTDCSAGSWRLDCGVVASVRRVWVTALVVAFWDGVGDEAVARLVPFRDAISFLGWLF